MKLIVTGSYEESSRIAADMFEEVIINKKNPLLGCLLYTSARSVQVIVYRSSR